jgi:membrane-associated phospholipid phosphatase
MRPFLALVVFAAAARALPAHGDEGLRYDPSLDVPLTAAGVAGTLGPKLLTDEDTAWTCRWCDGDAGGRDTLNGLDAWGRRAGRWNDRGRAHAWSNATLALSFAAPVGAFVAARGGFGDGLGEELLLVLESSALTLALTQGTKYLLRRERPWAHAGDPPDGELAGSRDSALSFASGHASLAFAVAVSTGSLASLRKDQGKEWVWATGLGFAAVTGYLRVAADRHYVTDVLAGAAIGAATGWVVPRLIDRRPKDEGSEPSQRRERPVPLVNLTLGRGAALGSGPGLLLTAGLGGGGPFVSATWGF